MDQYIPFGTYQSAQGSEHDHWVSGHLLAKQTLFPSNTVNWVLNRPRVNLTQRDLLGFLLSQYRGLNSAFSHSSSPLTLVPSSLHRILHQIIPNPTQTSLKFKQQLKGRPNFPRRKLKLKIWLDFCLSWVNPNVLCWLNYLILCAIRSRLVLFDPCIFH